MFGLLSRNKNAPKVPFRKMTEEEKERIRAYLKENPKRDNDDFWSQTKKEARTVIKEMRRGGFTAGGELPHGAYPENFGVHSHVYRRGFDEHEVRKSCDYNQVIGSVDLWSYWGFSSHPVKIWYRNPILITDSIQLRNYLTGQGISFNDGQVDFDKLRRQISELEKPDQSWNLEMLERLESLDLIKD